MHQNEKLLREFYSAFNKRDFKGMNSKYSKNAEFYDPVFENLKGKEIRAMWQMLCEQGKDLEVQLTGVRADESTGSCTWEAKYTFGTGKKVHNKVTSNFRFINSEIVSQKDDFDFYRWARMALGFIGVLIGWMSFVKQKVRKTAQKNLASFIKKHPELI